MKEGIEQRTKTNEKEMNDKEKNDIKSIFKKIMTFIEKNKRNSRYMIPLAIISIGITIYLGINLYNKILYLNQNYNKLEILENYNISNLKSNKSIYNDIKGIKKTSDLIDYYLNLQKENKRYKDYLNSIQLPYKNFMQNIYLPKLNIRKNPYNNEINLDMIGSNFLENNPYNDIALLQRRSDFFKDLGDNNESNEIQKIQIGDILETEEGYYYFPIKLSFQANSKRSFLLLIDKLSLTSDKLNILLINEFIYHLRENIKNKNKDKIEELLKNSNNPNFDTDSMIGYQLYKNIFENTGITLIDDKLLESTALNTVSCEEFSSERCLYEFREKYRNIPALAYLFNSNKLDKKSPTEKFKYFISHLPPVFSIGSFTFSKSSGKDTAITHNTKYIGDITINVYGRGVSDEEVEEIKKVLGQKCLNKAEDTLTPEYAVNLLDATISKTSSTKLVDINQSNNLVELRKILDETQRDFQSKSNYQKIISLFEIFRMMYDSNLCDI